VSTRYAGRPDRNPYSIRFEVNEDAYSLSSHFGLSLVERRMVGGGERGELERLFDLGYPTGP
jgi:hypothetical protein